MVDVEDGWSVRESHRFLWLPDWGEEISVVMVVRMVGIGMLVVVVLIYYGDADYGHGNDDDDDDDDNDDEHLTLPARINSQ